MGKLAVRSPYDGQLLDELELDDDAALERKLAVASELFRARRIPSKAERLAILERTARLIGERSESLARQAAQEGGKPLLDSRVELARAEDGVRAALAVLRQQAGREVPMGLGAATGGRLAWTVHEPLGVVGAISAFNHPFNLSVHQLIPAVATGCPVVIKPASKTPLSCRALLEILAEAGLPAGMAQMTLLPRERAARLARDSRLGFFTFIGSGDVGWALRKELAPGVGGAFEHGGVAPVVLHESADLERAARSVVKGGYYHAGQVCVSVQRVFVPRAQLEAFLEVLLPLVRALRVGDPLDETTEVGPLIAASELDRVQEWTAEAVSAGGRLVTGGERLSASCLAPALLVDPPDDVRVSQAEIFGPVVAVYGYETWDEALARANQVEACFQAAVFARDLDAALDAAARLRGTAVMINDHTAFRADWMPFGGQGASGLGRGGIDASMHDLSSEKLIVLRSSALDGR